MNRMGKIVAATLVTATLALGATGCMDEDDADVASHNVSKAADNFEVNRRIVFYNGVTDKFIMEIVGVCSIHKDVEQQQLEVTCKTGKNEFKKHFFGLSDNTPYFVEQGEPVSVSTSRYRVTFKPSTIVPDINFR